MSEQNYARVSTDIAIISVITVLAILILVIATGIVAQKTFAKVHSTQTQDSDVY